MLKERDIRQRTLGFISFSFLAHLGLIAATFLIPNVLKEAKQGSNSETYLVEAPSQASLGESAQAVSTMMPPPTEEPAKVMTAPVDDSSAIALPAKELPENEIKTEVKPIAKKVVTPAREKTETATKKVLALPAKKAAPVKAEQPVETVDQSDIEVVQALKAARESEESLPEVAADIEVPESNEPTSTEPQAEETEGAVAATVVTEEPAVESATTTSDDQQETVEAAPPAAAAQPAPSQPTIAPIYRGARSAQPLTQPSNIGGQVGGLGTTGNSSGAAGAIRDADSLQEQAGNAKPVYAADDQRAGRQGTVIFDAVVTREGVVQAIQLKQSSGHSTLDSSAYQAFKNHRYLPGQEGKVRKTFQFVLNGEATVPSRLRRR